MAKTKQTAIRLSDTDERILDALTEKKGVSRTAVLIMAMREMAEREKVMPGKPAQPADEA